jgi:hypothetical protein
MTRFSLQAATLVGALLCSAFVQAVPVTLQKFGGIEPALRIRSERHLTLAEREGIWRGLIAGDSLRGIARAVSRSPSTISQKINRKASKKINRKVRQKINRKGKVSHVILTRGDTINALAHFDDSLVAAVGGSTVELGTSGNAFGALLHFFVGLQQFSASNDADHLGSVFPIMDFRNGVFDGFDFIAEAGINGAPTDFIVDIFGFSGANGLRGSFDPQSVSITPHSVPEPATVALGFVALLAALTLRRRRPLALR